MKAINPMGTAHPKAGGTVGSDVLRQSGGKCTKPGSPSMKLTDGPYGAKKKA